MGVGAGLYMCDVVKKVHVRYLISWWVLVCTAHGRASPYFTMGRLISQSCPSHVWIWTPSNGQKMLCTRAVLMGARNTLPVFTARKRGPCSQASKDAWYTLESGGRECAGPVVWTLFKLRIVRSRQFVRTKTPEIVEKKYQFASYTRTNCECCLLFVCANGIISQKYPAR